MAREGEMEASGKDSTSSGYMYTNVRWSQLKGQSSRIGGSGYYY